MNRRKSYLKGKFSLNCFYWWPVIKAQQPKRPTSLKLEKNTNPNEVYYQSSRHSEVNLELSLFPTLSEIHRDVQMFSFNVKQKET